MFITVLCLAVFLLTTRDITELVKKRDWKPVVISACFISIGLGLSLLLQLGVEIPSLAGLLITLVKTALPFIPAFWGG